MQPGDTFLIIVGGGGVSTSLYSNSAGGFGGGGDGIISPMSSWLVISKYIDQRLLLQLTFFRICSYKNCRNEGGGGGRSALQKLGYLYTDLFDDVLTAGGGGGGTGSGSQCLVMAFESEAQMEP